MKRRVPRTKVRVPPVPQTYVPRPDLAHRISRMVTTSPVTLVSAPAGYGKTQTLADWVRRTHGPGSIAWVTVDRDDDPARLWAAIVEALSGCSAVPDGSSVRQLSSVGEGDDLTLVVDLLHALDAMTRPVHLVIDDLHEATASGALGLVERLLRNQPPTLRLVLASRIDPPLPLARLRVEGRLAELRAGDLRLSEATARQLLVQAGVELADDQVRQLVDRTEGWAAGLRLAALSLQRAPSTRSFVDDFAGGDRAVADYLVGEVLGGIPDELREFLRLLSICDEMPTGLAAALSRRDDAGRLLVRLERETALVSGASPGRGSYRVHNLLRSYLAADLERERPGEVARLHAAAARWYAEARDPARAIDHAMHAGDGELLDDLLHRCGVALLMSHDHAVVARGLASLATLSPTRTREDPWLCLLSAMVTTRAGGRPARAVADLDRARAARPRHEVGDLDLFRSLAEAEISESLPGGVVDSADRFPPQDPALAAWARADRGRALLFARELEAADEELDEAMTLVRRYGLDHLGVRIAADQALVRAVAGDYPAMVDRARTAIATGRDHGWSQTPALTSAHVMCAVADITAFRPAAAATELAAATRSARHLHAWQADRTVEALDAVASFDHRAARLDRSGRDHLLAVMRRCRTVLTGAVPLTEWAGALAMLEFSTVLACRDSRSIREILAWADVSLAGTGDTAVLHARAQLADGHANEARATVGPVVRGELACVVPSSRVEAWLVRAGADLVLGRTTAARAGLVRAVAEAAPATVVRPFHYADPNLTTLLVQHIGTFGNELEPVVETIVRRVGTDTTSSGTRELTERERTVLTLLQSHRSIDEIAGDLTVSTNTIKTHVRAVYLKLGVNSRRQAVVAAWERGLM